MENINFGALLFIVFFILLPLINYLLRRIGAHPDGQQPQGPVGYPMTDIPRGTHVAGTPVPSNRASRDRDREAQASAVIPPIAPARVTKRSLLRTRRDLRRAFIMMAVLGPCRAFDPGD